MNDDFKHSFKSYACENCNGFPLNSACSNERGMVKYIKL